MTRFLTAARALAARLHPGACRTTATRFADLRQAVEARTAALNASTAATVALSERLQAGAR